MELGLLLLRLAIGLTVAAHGAQKLFGTFGGPGIKGTGDWLSTLGFRNAPTFAVMAGLGELAGGLLLAVGLFTPLAAGLIIAVMAVATATVHLPKGFFNSNGGFELPFVLAAAAASVAFTGAGRLSLDYALLLPLGGFTWGVLAIVLGFAGAAFALALRAVGREQRTA